jgi:hypothetical protein
MRRQTLCSAEVTATLCFTATHQHCTVVHRQSSVPLPLCSALVAVREGLEVLHIVDELRKAVGNSKASACSGTQQAAASEGVSVTLYGWEWLGAAPSPP